MTTRTALRLASTAAAVTSLAGAAPALAAKPALVTCQPVKIASVHGGKVAANEQLSEIRNGRVLALDAAGTRRAQVPFRGRWVTTADGRRMAAAGQELRRDGRAYVVAARVRRDGRVLCAGPRRGVTARASDTASYGSESTLKTYYINETPASTRNATQQPLASYEDRVVCTGTSTHPDGAILYSHPTPTVWCFKGRGAWLSSQQGYDHGCPYSGCDPNYERCDYVHDPYPAGQHTITYLGATVPAQKRPTAKPNGEIIVGSAIAWRPVLKNLYYPAGFNPEAGRVAPPARTTYWDGSKENCVWTGGF